MATTPDLHTLRTALLLLLAGLGCGADPQAPDASRPASRAVVVDLVAGLPQARGGFQPEQVPLDDAGGAGLTSGWHRYEEAGPGEGFRWTGRRDAVVEVPILRPADRSLGIDLTPVRARLGADAETPDQTLKVLWNGSALATVALENRRQTVELEVPAGVQRIGPNRLELLPSYWLVPRAHQLGDDPRPLGLRIHGIALSSSDAPARGGDAPASLEEGAIRQRPGSVVTWYLVLPEAARLRAEVSRANAGGGTVTLALLDAEGRSERLLSESADALGPGLDLALPGPAGSMVALSVGFESADPAASIAWEGLRVEGREPVPAPAPPLPRGPYNVLLVVLDSLRADHTAPYGSTVVATPSLSRLAEAGVTFENAFTNSSWTRPAIASMLTSLYPSSHGVENMFQKLGAAPPYLPEILQAAGWSTLAVSNTIVISAPFGMARGFDALHLEFAARKRRAAEPGFSPESEARRLWERFLSPLVEGDRPFFAYLHEVDPHSPYTPASPYREMYDPGYRAHFEADFTTNDFVRRNPLWLEQTDVEALRAGYMGEISFMDRYLGTLLDALAESGQADRTLVVFASDHGEEFFDHRGMGHGATVFDELLRVPLLMALPGVLPAGRRALADVELLDVAPTVLDLLGMPIPDTMQGRSLLPAVFDDGAAGAPRVSVGHAHDAEFHALRYGGWKLIRENPGPGRAGQPQYTLFDLTRDPGEQVDVWPRELVVGHTLRQMLEEHLARTTREPAEVHEGVRAQLDDALHGPLQALGYVR